MPMKCIIALGGNLNSDAGSPADTIKAAVLELEAAGLGNLHMSRLFSTPCFPAGVGPDYVNATSTAQWQGSAAELLEALHRIESIFGRERVQRWGQRTLDLDLIALDDQVQPDVQTQAAWRGLSVAEQMEKAPEQLILPHPRLQDRAFVLVPLMDVAPDWVHPVTRASVRQMHANLPSAEKNAVKPL